MTEDIQFIEGLKVDREEFEKIKRTPEDLKKKGINPPSWLASEFVILETIERPNQHKAFVIPVESYMQFRKSAFIDIAPDKKYNAVVLVTGTA